MGNSAGSVCGICNAKVFHTNKKTPSVSTSSNWLELANAFTLPWSAYVRLLSVKDLPARQFYETEALRGGWSVRQLDRQIGSLKEVNRRIFQDLPGAGFDEVTPGEFRKPVPRWLGLDEAAWPINRRRPVLCHLFAHGRCQRGPFGQSA